jgi:hypothetical protein
MSGTSAERWARSMLAYRSARLSRVGQIGGRCLPEKVSSGEPRRFQHAGQGCRPAPSPTSASGGTMRGPWHATPARRGRSARRLIQHTAPPIRRGVGKAARRHDAGKSREPQARTGFSGVAAGKRFLDMPVAEFETNLRRERQLRGDRPGPPAFIRTGRLRWTPSRCAQ